MAHDLGCISGSPAVGARRVGRCPAVTAALVVVAYLTDSVYDQKVRISKGGIVALPEPVDDEVGRVVIRGRGQVTLPAHVRLQLGLKEGDDLLITVEDGRVVLTPGTLVPRDQAWYWTRRWQAGERAADADLTRGRRGRVFDSDEEFLAVLAAGVDDPTVLR
jgi:AbrB family looped-hinge helix DNA binding protein